MLVKLSDAAWLVGRHERVVRRRLLIPEGEDGHLPAKKDGRAWLIDTDALKQFWHIDEARLREMERRQRSTPDVMAARIAALESEIQTLKTRIAKLEGSERHQTRYDAILSEQYTPPLREDVYTPLARPTASVARSLSSDFRTHADGAAWLAEHGIAQNTVAGWKREMERAGIARDKRSYLGYAIERKRTAADAWRVPWELHTCSDVMCICHELLGSVEG